VSLSLERNNPPMIWLIWHQFGVAWFNYSFLVGVFALIAKGMKNMSIGELRMWTVLLGKLQSGDTEERDEGSDSMADLSETSMKGGDESDMPLWDLPIVLFFVNGDGKLTRRTTQAYELMGIGSGELLERSVLRADTIQALTDQMGRHCLDHSTESVLIQLDLGHSLSVTSYYGYRPDLVIEQVIVIEVDFGPNDWKERDQRLCDCFYSVIPRTIDLGRRLPALVESLGKQILVGIVALVGFDDWSEQAELVTLCTFRCALAGRFANVLNRSDKFIGIREKGNRLIFLMNRADTSINIWNMHEMSAELGKTIQHEFQSVCRRYHVSGLGCRVLLYRTKEPDYYVPEGHLSFVDFVDDVLCDTEQCLRFCKPGLVFLTSLRREARFAGATKVRQCVKTDGTLYDLFMAV